MARRLQKKPRRRRSPLRRAAKFLYGMTVALSAVIVVTYAGFRVMAQPPEVSDPAETAAQAPLVQSSAQPDTSPEQTPGRQRKDYTYTFLLVASDQSSGNTDTMMVATYDTVNQTVGLVSLPRDTMIDGVKESNGKQFHKLNSMYAYNGMDALRSEVSKILGFPIDFYVKVNTRGFVELVDAVGGVDFYVPVDMNYDDPTQDLHIHFSKGSQWLSGSDALKVARCRQNSYIADDGSVKTYDVYANADIGRTETQRALLSAVIQKALTQPLNFPTYYEIFLDNVETNLTAGNLAYFAEKAIQFDFSAGLTTAVLPGDGTVTYRGWTYCYELDPDQVLELVNTQGLNPYTTDITADMLDIVQKN